MKKYIGFLLCVSAALFAASCGEKQSLEVDNTPKLKVVSHDVVFQPDGGTGSITVECESAITAEVQTTNSAGEKWCTATVDGKKINVTVGKYSGVESRYSNIIIKGADETLNVAVHQYGIIMNEFDADDAIIKNPAQTLSYAYKANALMQASSSVDWITVSTTDNKLEVKVAENTSKEYRQGTVEWNVGMLKGSFVLTQFDAADAGDEQADNGGYCGDDLGFLVHVLLGQTEDDKRQEGHYGHDHAQVVPEPEFGWVRF